MNQLAGVRTNQCQVTVVAVLVTLIVSVVHAEWTQFGGPDRTFAIEATDADTKNGSDLHRRWTRTIGPGMSGVVVKQGVAYVSYLQPFTKGEAKQPESERDHQEVVEAIDCLSGDQVWQYRYASGWLESQQAFGGRARAPQATPAISGKHLLSIGFSGLAHCFDRSNGELKWKINLVDEFEATPVQFGFASSPIVHDDSFLVLAGGKEGGLVCIDVVTGKPRWKVPCKEASYASPVLLEVGETTHIVFYDAESTCRSRCEHWIDVVAVSTTQARFDECPHADAVGRRWADYCRAGRRRHDAAADRES